MSKLQLVEKLGKTFSKVSYQVSKHSPLILTTAGIVGIGATGYLAYKSKSKVEEVLDNMDLQESLNQELESINAAIAENAVDRNEELLVDLYEQQESVKQALEEVGRTKAQHAMEFAKAIAMPVITGVLTVSAFAASYYIQNNRIVNLAGALAASTAEHVAYRNRVSEKYGEEAEQQISTPVSDPKTVTKTDEDGKKVKEEAYKKNNDLSLHGAWFSESDEYVSDDIQYNHTFIQSVASSLDLKFFNNGYLRLNQVLDALGLPRTRAGETVGWTTGDNFFLGDRVINVHDGDEDYRADIYIQWPPVKSIYHDVEYEGRYS